MNKTGLEKMEKWIKWRKSGCTYPELRLVFEECLNKVCWLLAEEQAQKHTDTEGLVDFVREVYAVILLSPKMSCAATDEMKRIFNIALSKRGCK